MNKERGKCWQMMIKVYDFLECYNILYALKQKLERNLKKEEKRKENDNIGEKKIERKIGNGERYW